MNRNLELVLSLSEVERERGCVDAFMNINAYYV